METIAAPTDFLGVNYYAPRVIEAVPGDTPWPWRVVVPDNVRTTAGFTEGVPRPRPERRSCPCGLTDLLVRIRRRLRRHTDHDHRERRSLRASRVHDERRVAFLHDHVAAVHDAIVQGVDVIGYCHWSLLDNFEWALGYGQRFGLVHVDFDTQQRTIKDSGRAFARIAAANGLEGA